MKHQLQVHCSGSSYVHFMNVEFLLVNWWHIVLARFLHFCLEQNGRCTVMFFAYSVWEALHLLPNVPDAKEKQKNCCLRGRMFLDRFQLGLEIECWQTKRTWLISSWQHKSWQAEFSLFLLLVSLDSLDIWLHRANLIFAALGLTFTGFANFIDEWSHCHFCFTNFGVILEYLESSITTKKAIFRLSSTWSWHVYTIVRDTRSSCGGLLTWKAQIHDGGHRVNFDHNLPTSCFVMQYNSLILMI